MYFTSIIIGAAALAAIGAESSPVAKTQLFKHVAVFSIDGFHATDVEKYVVARPKSTIAQLLETGYEYTNAYTSEPSDSFPGTVAQFTGASPRTTGIFYDDTYDRTFYLPSSNCSGPPGAEVQYTEVCDYNDTLLFSGGIDPANLPQSIVNGVCTDIYPHARLRVNTVFEIARAAGMVTAYTDKHPAYDVVRGPSGTGLSLGYFPEINAIPTLVNTTIQYDDLHVSAFLDWINATDPAHSEGTLDGRVPNLFGGNFQSINVAEKQDGYENATNNPFTPGLLATFDFIDQSFARIVSALRAKNIYNETLIVVASKHGNAPINPAKYAKINPALVMNATGVDILQQTSDDIAIIWLANHSDTEKAVANLQKQASALKIKNIIYGQTLIDRGFGNPLTDPAVPDIFVEPVEGIIYTTSKTKIAEHGGFHQDDRHIACFVSNPRLKKRKISTLTSTRQVGPTILKALGLNVTALQGAHVENTTVLQGF
ncbi:hypothetical protein MMC32_001711 [Xylographa parallela]|nr:hypothetical protein [Xylographa parallela]